MKVGSGRGFGIAVLTMLGIAGMPAQAAVTKEAVNQAQLKKPLHAGMRIQPLLVKAQVLLKRAWVSPGVIDGRYGANTKKALRVFQQRKGLPVTGKLDSATWKFLDVHDDNPVLGTYTITRKDVKGPFLKKIPRNMRKMAKLGRMSYTSPRELLAERFHMTEPLLKTLNPTADFRKPDTSIVVARLSDLKPSGVLASIVVDKKSQAVKGYDKEGKLLVFYPATVGSVEFPSPTGNLKVTGVTENPKFTLTSKLKYAKLKKGESVVIAPGPNNPVGTVWIGLSKPGYGIHGSPQPELIRKRESHGCVRLTNWDAQELAHLVHKGLPVRFVG